MIQVSAVLRYFIQDKMKTYVDYNFESEPLDSVACIKKVTNKKEQFNGINLFFLLDQFHNIQFSLFNSKNDLN